MRTSFTAVLGSLLLMACGSDDRPAAADAYSEYAERSTPNAVADDPASTEPSDPQASPAQLCKAANIQLLGSCAVHSGAQPFESGAHCLEYYDASTATTKDLQKSCRCSGGVWSAEQCDARVASGECRTESTTACGRSVWCYPQ